MNSQSLPRGRTLPRTANLGGRELEQLGDNLGANPSSDTIHSQRSSEPPKREGVQKEHSAERSEKVGESPADTYSQEIDVVGKPMIPSARKDSGKSASVTPDTLHSQETKPEPRARGASNAMDEMQGSFIKDKTPDTFSPVIIAGSGGNLVRKKNLNFFLERTNYEGGHIGLNTSCSHCLKILQASRYTIPALHAIVCPACFRKWAEVSDDREARGKGK